MIKHNKILELCADDEYTKMVVAAFSGASPQKSYEKDPQTLSGKMGSLSEPV